MSSASIAIAFHRSGRIFARIALSTVAVARSFHPGQDISDLSAIAPLTTLAASFALGGLSSSPAIFL